jgi:hypothetical protein
MQSSRNSVSTHVVEKRNATMKGKIAMPITLREGETGDAADAIDYPEINSCLTITYINPQGHLYGGHAVVPVDLKAGQKTPNQIVDFIRPHIQNGGKLLLVGSLEVWAGHQIEAFTEKKYSSLDALAADLKGQKNVEVIKEDKEQHLITVRNDGSVH